MGTVDVFLVQIDRQRSAGWARLLEAEGLAPVVIRDGAEALRLLEARGLPGLLITDLSLAGLDGFALLRELRARAPAEQVPAIVLSAFPHLREQAFLRREELGIFAALPASVSWEVLRRCVERARTQAKAEGRYAPHQEDDRQRQSLQRHRAGALSAAPVAALQAIADETAQRLNVPTCFVSLVVEGHAYVKAATNFPTGIGDLDTGAARWSFCQQLTEAMHPLVVCDAPAHPAFSAEPVVREGLVGSYLGVPVTTSEGVAVGALGVLACEPRHFGVKEVDELTVIARRVAAELELSASPPMAAPFPAEAYFRAALAYLPIGVLFIGPNHKLAFANSRAAELLGIPLDELGQVTRAEVVGRLSQRGATPEDLQELLRAPPLGPYVENVELELVKPERQVLSWSCRPVPLGDETGQMVLITDMTHERQLLEDGERMARTDQLTGLGNRRNAEEAIAREVIRARRHATPLSFILFDIDHFKRVNDTHGHAVGDRALRALGELLRASFRGFDLASRWGGEEFLIVLPGADLFRARQVADRVRAQIEKTPIPMVGTITVSAGVTELEKDETADEALGRADEKLYEAKAAGRNRIA